MGQQKKVLRLPAEEVWAGARLVSTTRLRDLNAADIVELLRTGAVRFVVADVGKPYEWVPNNEGYEFWKNEVKDHLAAPDSRPASPDSGAAFRESGTASPDAGVALERFPGEYCYFASEWKSYEGETIILLSKAH